MNLTGFHHLTAMTANASSNVRFYTETLGLRLVKKTVNQDDTSAYHLFYGDGKASPGSDVTFFDWPTPPERRGTSSVVRTGLRVAPDALPFWARRLESLGVPNSGLIERLNRQTIDFEDPEGQRLALVADETISSGNDNAWAKSPVPAGEQIRGLGPITISVPTLAPTDAVLRRVMNFRRLGTTGDVHAYATAPTDLGPAAELHVVVEAESPRARHGAGGVHHVAFRVPDAAYDAWAERLEETGARSSGPVDRFYFRSLYFREPGGVLFELATDGPGFTADEPLATLGEKLSLPPFLESRRATIEAGLRPL